MVQSVVGKEGQRGDMERYIYPRFCRYFWRV